MYISRAKMYISAAEIYIPAAEMKFITREMHLCKAYQTTLQRKLTHFPTYVYRNRKGNFTQVSQVLELAQ